MQANGKWEWIASLNILLFFKNFFPQIGAKFDSKWKQNHGLGSLHKALLIFSDNSPLANLCKQEPCLLSGVI